MPVKPGVISEIREKIPLKRSEFAEILEVSENYLYRVEMGMRKPSMKLLKRIAELSGVTVETLIEISKKNDDPYAERLFSGARMYMEIVAKLRRERHNRRALEERNSELEHAMEHLMALLHLHLQFEDILCRESPQKGQRMEKIRELAKVAALEGEMTFSEIMVTLRLERALLKKWLASEQRVYRCQLIEGHEAKASTAGEAAMRLRCFECEYHESRECSGYGDEKRPENIIALLLRLEANGIYNRSDQSELLKESYGISISAHHIAEIAYRYRKGLKMPEDAFNLDSAKNGKKP